MLRLLRSIAITATENGLLPVGIPMREGDFPYIWLLTRTRGLFQNYQPTWLQQLLKVACSLLISLLLMAVLYYPWWSSNFF